MRYISVFAISAMLIAGGAVLSAEAGSKAQKQESSKAGTQTPSDSGTSGPTDAAGNVDQPSSTREKAVQKDREASQHLGAGTGTSSGTGPGKMQSGSGPR
jgi:hypothetical protein